MNKMSDSRTLIATAALAVAALTSPASAQVTGSFTVDNAYAVYIGDANGISNVTPTLNNVPLQNPITQNINTFQIDILRGEQFEFDFVPECQIYLVAWSDSDDWQGAIGSFTGDVTLSTGDPRIRVGAAVNDKDSRFGQAPTAAEVDIAIGQLNSGDNGGWVTPAIDTNGAMTNVFGTLSFSGLASNAQWIWRDSGDDNSASAPFSGFNHGEFLIFRIPCADLGNPDLIAASGTGIDVGNVPMGTTQTTEPATEICCPPFEEGTLESLFLAQFEGSPNGPFRLMTDSAQWSAFSAKMQAWVDFLHAYDPNTTSITIGFHLRGRGPAGSPPNGPASQIPGMPSRFVRWNALSTSAPTGSTTFWNSYGLQPNQQYTLHTTMGTNDESNFALEGDCFGAMSFAWDYEALPNARTTGRLIIDGSAGRRIVQPQFNARQTESDQRRPNRGRLINRDRQRR